MSLFGDWDAARRYFAGGAERVGRVIEHGLRRAGAQMQRAARTYIRNQEGDWEPLKPATVARKAASGKSNKLLIEDAELIREITYEVDGEAVTCGVLATSSRAGAARAHEYGYEPGGIPKRSFIHPAIREALDRGEIIGPFREGIAQSIAGGRLRSSL